MLQAGQTNAVSFNVNIMGTSSEPKVRVIISTSPEISFSAVQTGDSWTADLAIPETVQEGTYDLRVEVLLNSRLFTPVNKKVQILGLAAADVGQEAPKERVEPAATEAPLASETPAQAQPRVRQSMMAQLNPDVQPPKEIVMPRIVAKMPKIVKRVQTESAPPMPKASLTLESLCAVASQAPKKRMKPLSSGMPKGDAIKKEPTKIKISEIDAVTSKKVSKIVERKVKPEKVKNKTQSTSIVKLVKEHVFYE